MADDELRGSGWDGGGGEASCGRMGMRAAADDGHVDVDRAVSGVMSSEEWRSTCRPAGRCIANPVSAM